MELKWENAKTLDSKSYVCGYCGNPLASNQGFWAVDTRSNATVGRIYICHHCLRPTYFDDIGKQVPGSAYGRKVDNVPVEVSDLYDESRKCTSCGAYMAAVLCCRKLLMNVAVSKGAQEGLSFVDYIEFLSQRGFVPPDGKEWVDHIRRKGNEATHEIAPMTRQDAEDLIDFAEMLLKFIYEFPAIIKTRSRASAS